MFRSVCFFEAGKPDGEGFRTKMFGTDKRLEDAESGCGLFKRNPDGQIRTCFGIGRKKEKDFPGF